MHGRMVTGPVRRWPPTLATLGPLRGISSKAFQCQAMHATVVSTAFARCEDILAHRNNGRGYSTDTDAAIIL